MNQKSYFSVLFVMIIAFLSLMGMLSGFSEVAFLREVLITLAFIIMAVISLYLITMGMKLAWSFTLFFFTLNLINAVYIYLFSNSILLVLYTLAVAVGLVISVNRLASAKKSGKKFKVRKARAEEGKTSSSGKAKKSTSAKKASRKKAPKKKTSKSKSAGRPRKSSKKRAKSSAKRKTSKKSSSKKR
ncbi:MAG: hypothetical protein ACQEP1_03640 [Nanobdellota archaeon]